MKVSEHYKILDQIGNLGQDKGFLRAGYSKEEASAIEYFQKLLSEKGFSCKYDSIGNFSAEIPGESGKFIEVASHVDTVPNGGNFDGLAGVVAGYEAITRFHVQAGKLKHGLRLRVWRLEESGTFNAVYTGSLGAFGQFSAKLLENKFQGITLRDAIRASGFDSKTIEDSQPTITQSEIDSIFAHFELHIEQGTVLENTRKKIGIVTSIRGNQRYIVNLTGRFNHSGSTPMGVEYRKDCNLALAYMITELDHLKKEYPQVMLTFGMINSDLDYSKQFGIAQNGFTKVSGTAFFSIDIRASKLDELQKYSEAALEKLKEVAKKYKVEIGIKDLGLSKPMESLSDKLSLIIEESCKEKNIPYTFMPSGGGHDALVVAKQKQSDGQTIPVIMIFVPCKDGVSHDPKEYATFEDIELGVDVLQDAILRLSK